MNKGITATKCKNAESAKILCIIKNNLKTERMEKMNFSNSRDRYHLAKFCPCGKSNKDGKFSPDKNDPNCGYCHACDKTFFNNEKEERESQPMKELPPKPPTLLDRELIQGAFAHYDKNNFIKALKKYFPNKDLEAKAKAYGIGTSKHWQGATIFFQDTGTEIRGGKVMLYDEVTAKRIKEPANRFNWLHKILKLEPYNLVQCLFGLHLIKDNTKPIAVVESEKTAFIMSLVDDNFIWVATGGKGNFKHDILAPLKGKKVHAFPDSGEFKTWKEKALGLELYGISVEVSEELETYPIGTDLADIELEEIQAQQKSKKTPQDTQQVTQQVETSSEKIYDIKEMQKLAECIIPEQDERAEKDFLRALNQLEGLDHTQAKNLINKMIINDIVSKTTLKTYYLFNSTPF